MTFGAIEARVTGPMQGEYGAFSIAVGSAESPRNGSSTPTPGASTSQQWPGGGATFVTTTGWIYDAATGRYRDMRTGAFVPAEVIRGLRNDFVESRRKAMLDLAQQLAAGVLDVDEWQAAMRAEIKMGLGIEYAFGRGGLLAMSPLDWDQVGEMVSEQWSYLDKFADALIDARLSPAQLAQRATMYADAGVGAFERGQAKAWDIDLPEYPGEACDGMTNCRCYWDMVEQDDGSVDCYWVAVGDKDTCDPCADNERQYSPYTVEASAGFASPASAGAPAYDPSDARAIVTRVEAAMREQAAFRVDMRSATAVLAMLPTDLREQIARFHEQIAPQDLDEGGLEPESHVTLKYGIDPSVSDDQVASAIGSTEPIDVTFGPIAAFPAGDSGVPLYVSVMGSGLYHAHQRLGDLPNSDTRVEYVPHVTIAFVKPEAADKYVGLPAPIQGHHTLHTFTISRPDGSQKTLDLPGAAAFAESDDDNGHWVTIDGHPVFLPDDHGPSTRGDHPGKALSWRAGHAPLPTTHLTGGVDPPNLPHQVAEQRLLDLYDRAAKSGAVEHDRTWYADKHEQIGDWAKQLDLDPQRFTEVVAATSPLTAWDLPRSSRLPNLEAARAMVQVVRAHPDLSAEKIREITPHTGQNPMLGNSVENAARILKGESPESVLETPKIRSFANDLSHPDNKWDVTVDTHMGRAMLDLHDDTPEAKKAVGVLVQGRKNADRQTMGGYGWAADRIRTAAERRGVSPLEFQAITWEQWRREGGGHGKARMAEDDEPSEAEMLRDWQDVVEWARRGAPARTTDAGFADNSDEGDGHWISLADGRHIFILDSSGNEQHSKDARDAMRAIPRTTGDPHGDGSLKNPIYVDGHIEDAAREIAAGHHVRLDQPAEVSTLIDRLGTMAEDAAAKGDKAPLYDLALVSIPGTNLFTQESKGIPRVEMPQLQGRTVKGSLAEKTEGAKANLYPAFRKELESLGYQVTDEEVRAADLRATQRDLNGATVAAVMHRAEAGNLPDQRIMVSGDNYVLDGHHRWAAKVGIDLRNNVLGDVTMPVARVNTDIGTLLDLTRTYATAHGVEQGRSVSDARSVLPAKFDDDDDGHWITLDGGQHIFIANGGNGSGRKFAPDVVKATNSVRSMAKAQEQHVSPVLLALADENQGKLQGYAFRLKGTESLARKISDRAEQKGITAEESAKDIGDALRYTMEFSPDRLTSATREVQQTLERQGYKVAIDNFWQHGDSYNGLNGSVHDPKSGMTWELQFHTPESYDLKEHVLHKDYEVARDIHRPVQERFEAFERMRLASDALDTPPDVMTIGVPRLKPFKP